jgi:DNA-binding NarL/FixJ family response regulator
MSRLHARVGTLRQLEILLAVHEAGTVTGAAEALHLTQPTVSMQLRKLVDAMGMPLYQQQGWRQWPVPVGLWRSSSIWT